MCRFLLVKTKDKFKIDQIAFEFAKKCQLSKEWQGDGWGICWLEDNKTWKGFKSLFPIWEEKKFDFPQSRIFLLHARSSSFKEHKNKIEYNQPFFDDKLAFVFNGFVSKVKLNFKVEGEIGAQKIFNLIKKFAKKFGTKKSILKVKDLVQKNSEKIDALNLGVCDKKNFYVLCFYSKDPDYYQLWYSKKKNFVIVSSEKISRFNFKRLPNRKISIL